MGVADYVAKRGSLHDAAAGEVERAMAQAQDWSDGAVHKGVVQDWPDGGGPTRGAVRSWRACRTNFPSRMKVPVTG